MAKLCNEARACPDREKVTEQIITHWFQNKRKMNRKSKQYNYAAKLLKLKYNFFYFKATPEESSSKSPSDTNGNKGFSNLDFNNQIPVDYQDLIEDAHIAAYKSIMDRNSPDSSKSNSDEEYDV